jgi:hypothetical protein
MFLAWKRGESVRAQRLAGPIAQLTAALFRETNPVPVKYALALLDLIVPKVRLPLVGLGERCYAELEQVLFRMCDEYPEYLICSTIGAFGSRPAKFQTLSQRRRAAREAATP